MLLRHEICELRTMDILKQVSKPERSLLWSTSIVVFAGPHFVLVQFLALAQLNESRVYLSFSDDQGIDIDQCSEVGVGKSAATLKVSGEEKAMLYAW